MAITKPPKKNVSLEPETAADAFIRGAPDSATTPRKGVMKGRKQQITVTIDPEIINQLDARAEQEGLSRAALINMAVRQLLNKGVTIGGD